MKENNMNKIYNEMMPGAKNKLKNRIVYKIQTDPDIAKIVTMFFMENNLTQWEDLKTFTVLCQKCNAKIVTNKKLIKSNILICSKCNHENDFKKIYRKGETTGTEGAT